LRNSFKKTWVITDPTVGGVGVVFKYNLLVAFSDELRNSTSMTKLTNVFFFFLVEYLPEDGLKRPKHVGGLLYDCIFLYRIVV